MPGNQKINAQLLCTASFNSAGNFERASANCQAGQISTGRYFLTPNINLANLFGIGTDGNGQQASLHVEITNNSLSPFVFGWQYAGNPSNQIQVSCFNGASAFALAYNACTIKVYLESDTDYSGSYL